MMVYDARLYTRLSEQGKCRRIVNIVLSFDKSGHSGPTSLRNMLPHGESDADGAFAPSSWEST